MRRERQVALDLPLFHIGLLQRLSNDSRGD